MRIGLRLSGPRRSWALAVVAAALIAIPIAVSVLIAGYLSATARPLVRQLSVRVPDYPRGASPVRIVLFSDVHVHGPDMPPARVARIVEQINALRPDVVVAAGDFVGDNWFGRDYPADQAIAPLRDLKARFGVYAVLGNNDYSAGAGSIVQALNRAGVRVLINGAARAGPIAVAGLDGRVQKLKPLVAARAKTYGALERIPGPRILIVHRPDEVVDAPDSIGLVLAGHTHCGQIVLPLVGALVSGSDYGRKYLCGRITEGSKLLVVTAGLGTSHVPIRIGAPPDLWLITIAGTR